MVLTEASVTGLLQRWSSGDLEALDELMRQVYDELHRIAARCFQPERQEHTLQATALLHEAVVRLVDIRQLDWQGRGHFYAVAARTMRRVLVDHARQRRRLKRGSERARVSLEESEALAMGGKGPEIEALHDALKTLEARDPQKAKIVELRFFAGLTGAEIARCLDISPPTVTRQWRRARIWLYCEISGEDLHG